MLRLLCLAASAIAPFANGELEFEEPASVFGRLVDECVVLR